MLYCGSIRVPQSMWHWEQGVLGDTRLETEFWTSSQQPSPRLSSSPKGGGRQLAPRAVDFLSFPSLPSEPQVRLSTWRSHMPTVSVFSDSSRFKVPLDTAGGSYEPLVLRFFNSLMEIWSPQRAGEPEEPEYSHISWSPPKHTEPVGHTFALGVSSDKEWHPGGHSRSLSSMLSRTVLLWGLDGPRGPGGLSLVGKGDCAEPILSLTHAECLPRADAGNSFWALKPS